MRTFIRTVVFATLASLIATMAHPAEVRTFFLPGPVELPADKIPVDILAATLAASRAAKGEGDLGGSLHLVKLAPKANIVRDVAGQPPVAKEFKVDKISLISVVPSKRFDKGQKIFGTIDFTHRGLRVRQAFIVDYLASSSGITIGELSVMAVTPPDHRVALFALPASDARRLVENTALPYAELVDFAGSHGRALPLSGPIGDTVLVALSLDRVLAGDRLEIALDAADGKAVSPPFLTFTRQGFPMALLPLAQQTSGKVTVTRHTDMHDNKDDGRREIASLALTAAPVVPAPSKPPAGPAAKPRADVAPATSDAAAAGGWQADDAEKPTQLTYATAARADEPELFILCDRANAELHLLYRKLESDAVERMRDQPGSLDGSLTAGDKTQALTGFVSRAPEATGIGYDVLVTANSLALFTALDLKLRFPGFEIAAPGDGLLARFAAACPSVSTVYESNAWRRRINLQAGFAVDLPVGLFRLTDADRTGRFYRDGPGRATMQVSTVINQDDLTTRDALRKMSRDKDVISHVAKSSVATDSLTFTGTKGNRSVFVKALLTCNKSNWAIVRIDYDPSARAEIEPIIARIAQSFTPQGAIADQAPCE